MNASELVVSIPSTVLVASQPYTPASSLLTLLIIKMLPITVNLSLFVIVSLTLPLFLNHSIVGVGTPLTEQVKLVFSFLMIQLLPTPFNPVTSAGSGEDHMIKVIISHDLSNLPTDE